MANWSYIQRKEVGPFAWHRLLSEQGVPYSGAKCQKSHATLSLLRHTRLGKNTYTTIEGTKLKFYFNVQFEISCMHAKKMLLLVYNWLVKKTRERFDYLSTCKLQSLTLATVRLFWFVFDQKRSIYVLLSCLTMFTAKNIHTRKTNISGESENIVRIITCAITSVISKQNCRSSRNTSA